MSKNEMLFLRPNEKVFRCFFCGKTIVAFSPPLRCPICHKEKQFQEIHFKAKEMLDRDMR